MRNGINERIKTLSNELSDKVIAHRRRIHTFAETGGKEFKTHAYIAAELERLGIPYENVGGTGLFGTFDTGRQGPHILLRADIDALPMSENPNNLKGKRVCVSEQKNTAHACGHDAHAAMLLGSIELLLQLKDELSGVLYFLFEPGEENGYGFPHVTKLFSGLTIDTIWGIHVYAPLESGKLSVKAGARMAGTIIIDLTVRGKGGHASRQDLTINPVFVAAQIVSNLPGALIHMLNAEKTVTFGIAGIHGGEVGNIIPNEAHIIGGMRFFDREEGRKALDILKSTAEHTAAIYGAEIEYGKHSAMIGKPLVNDAECSAVAEQGLGELLPEGTLVDGGRWFASESMSMYLEKIPGVFAFLGINSPDKGTGAEHHNEYFDVDEDVLKTGVTATAGYVFSYISNYANKEARKDE